MKFSDDPSSSASHPDRVFKKQISLSKIRKVYLDESTADVHFSFENATTSSVTRIPAHKFPLALESDAFKAMFYGDLKETGDVNIVDVSVDAFKEFLQFFYFDKIKLTMKNITEVIYLVKKYIVDDSMSICEQYLNESLTIDNVCTIYDIAIRFDIFSLKLQCQNRIKMNAEAVFKSNDFQECSKSVLAEILLFSALSCTENQLFLACMDWLKAASGQNELTKELVRDHMGDIFYEIRFGSMKIQEFSELMPAYGHLFSADEYREIVQMIGSNEFEPKMFKKGCRQIYSENQAFQATLASFSSTTFGFSLNGLGTNTAVNPPNKINPFIPISFTKP